MLTDVKDFFPLIKETGEGWRANCPRCGDEKMRLYWNSEKNVGCCFHAGCPWYKDRGGVTAYRLTAYLKGQGIQITIPDVIEKAPNVELELPEEFHTLDEMKRKYSEPIYDYLEARGLRKKIVDRARVGYCREGKMWGYIIFPVFNPDGELVYWQGRRFKDRKSKFFNPVSSNKNEIIYQIRSEAKPKYIVIVESIINALTLESGWEGNDVVIMATLGKGLTEYQKQRILTYERKGGQELWLGLDPDAIREALDFAKYVGTFMTVRIPRFSEGEDINSLGFPKAYKIMKHAEIYDPKRHIQFLTGAR